MAAPARRQRNTAADAAAGGERSVGSGGGNSNASVASSARRSRDTALASIAASAPTARQGTGDSAAGVSPSASSHGMATATGGGNPSGNASAAGNQASSAASNSGSRRPNPGASSARRQSDRVAVAPNSGRGIGGSDDRRFSGETNSRRTNRRQQRASPAPASPKFGGPANARRLYGGGGGKSELLRPPEVASEGSPTLGSTPGLTPPASPGGLSGSPSRRVSTESEPKIASPWLKDQEFVPARVEPCKGTPYTTSIRVVARIRPKLQREADEVDCLQVTDSTDIIIRNEDGDTKQFAVDEVFDSREGFATQSHIYSKVGHDLAMQALKGFNVCIFAYGHTGSGKTHTMLGDGAAAIAVQGNGAGLLPRFVTEIFDKIAAANLKGEDPHYTCEYYEVYNEQIRDLLAPSGDERKRTVHVHPKYGVRINGLSTSIIRTAEEALGLVYFGNQMRTVATTTMNERSSRSHAIFTFNFVFSTQINIDAGEEKELTWQTPTGTHRESTVMFVDLAGREDQLVSTNEGDRFREMCHINTSLFHLTHLITKLSENKVQSGSLADFRNSKLTLLLSQALVGNSRTALVATLAPPLCYVDDTLASLLFAQKVKKVQTRPIVNNKTSKAVLSDLEHEVQALKRQLCLAQGSGAEKEQELVAAQAMIEHYKRSWEDALKDSQKVKNARSRMTMKLGLTSDGVNRIQSLPNLLSGDESPCRGALCPFFTKLSDDASLQGCCNYFLGRPVLTIGSAEDNDIVLQGVGIRTRMCEVRTQVDAGFEDESRITVELPGRFEDSDGDSQCPPSDSASDADDVVVPRVLVNGKALTNRETWRAVRHGDSVILGYAHAFRLVVPTRERMMKVAKADEPGAYAHLLPSLDMETAIEEIEEDGGEFKEVFPYLRQLQAHVSEIVVQELLKSLRSICPLIDEANMITKEVFADNRQRFELHVLTDLFNFDAARTQPKLVVCVLQPQPQSNAVSRKSTYVDPDAASFSRKSTCDHPETTGVAMALSRQASFSETGTPRQRSATEGPGGTSPRSPRLCSKQSTVSMLPGRMLMTAVSQAGLTDHMIGAQGDPMLYVWTLEKFLRRLGEMRDIYQEATESHEGWPAARRRLKAKPYLNPWQELAFADVKLLAVDSGNAQTIWEDETPQSPHSPHDTADSEKTPGSVGRGASPPQSWRSVLAHQPVAARQFFAGETSVGRLAPAPEESRRSSKSSTQAEGSMTIRDFGEAVRRRSNDAVAQRLDLPEAGDWSVADATHSVASAARGAAGGSTDGAAMAAQPSQPHVQTHATLHVPKAPQSQAPQLQSRSQVRPMQQRLPPQTSMLERWESAASAPSLLASPSLQELHWLRTELQTYQQHLEAQSEYKPTPADKDRFAGLLDRFETLLNLAAAGSTVQDAPLVDRPHWPPYARAQVLTQYPSSVATAPYVQFRELPQLLHHPAMGSATWGCPAPMSSSWIPGRAAGRFMFASFPTAPLPEAVAAPVTLGLPLSAPSSARMRSPSPAASFFIAPRASSPPVQPQGQPLAPATQGLTLTPPLTPSSVARVALGVSPLRQNSQGVIVAPVAGANTAAALASGLNAAAVDRRTSLGSQMNTVTRLGSPQRFVSMRASRSVSAGPARSRSNSPPPPEAVAVVVAGPPAPVVPKLPFAAPALSARSSACSTSAAVDHPVQVSARSSPRRSPSGPVSLVSPRLGRETVVAIGAA